MFDSEGNLWVGDNFTVGWQGQDARWQGHATKFSPNGKPLSPTTTGFAGGGMQGGTFGAAIDSHDHIRTAPLRLNVFSWIRPWPAGAPAAIPEVGEVRSSG